MPALSKKTEQFTDSVIRRMTRIANLHQAVNLSQGFPDFDPPQALKNALRETAAGSIHQYAVTWGAQDFREALANKQRRFMGIPIDPETDIVVTCGSTEAMMVAVMTVCDPGDRVVVFSPFYENYAADAILTGAVPVYIPLRPPAFTFDAAELEEAFRRERPKAIIVCNPANPTGKVFTREELLTIGRLAETYDAFVITDEVYEHIVYAPNVHTYVASLPGMRERTISCSSLSKTYSITGWRLGYLIAPRHVTEAARKVHDFLTVGAASTLQAAAVTALNFDDAYYAELLREYTVRKAHFLNGLQSLGFSYTDPQGAYYVMVDISAYACDSDLEFCEWMAREIKVAAVPGSSFFRENVKSFVRFHFAKELSTLDAALGRLADLPQKARAQYGLR